VFKNNKQWNLNQHLLVLQVSCTCTSSTTSCSTRRQDPNLNLCSLSVSTGSLSSSSIMPTCQWRMLQVQVVNSPWPLPACPSGMSRIYQRTQYGTGTMILGLCWSWHHGTSTSTSSSNNLCHFQVELQVDHRWNMIQSVSILVVVAATAWHYYY